MNALAQTATPGRRLEGAGRVIGLGQACANGGGAANTKTINNTEAWPADAGRANGVWSAEPMRRPDHKAKKHGRPAKGRHKRRKDARQDWSADADTPPAPQPTDARMTHRDVGLLVEVTQAAKLLGAVALTMAVTLTVCWPLRFDGEMLWVAMGAAI